jgi:hypothetical protein
MSTKAQGNPDMPLSTPAAVKAMVEVQAHWQHLEKDLELLRGFVDRGYPPERLIYGTLSAQLYASELLARLVKLQIVLADEGAK